VRARPLEAARLRADGDCPFGAGLLLGACRARSTDVGGDETAGGTVPALRLSSHPGVSSTGGSSHEPTSRSPPLAPGRPAASSPTTAAARGGKPTTPASGNRAESCVGLRLRVRCLRQRSAAEVPDGDRRVHPGVPGHRRRRLDPFRARDRGACAPDQRARRPALPALGQRA